MNILALDTSGPAAGVALLKEGAVAHAITSQRGRTHSQTIMPMVDAALRAGDLRVDDIDLLAVTVGPGSFTGVRIGVCTIKAFAHATGVPVVGVDALEALAMGAYGFGGVVCPILDARRGQVYGAAFAFGDGALPERLMPDSALALEAYLDALPKGGALLFTGDGLAAHADSIRRALGARARMAPPHMAHLSAAAVAALADIRRGEAVVGARIQPMYLRRPQAERERDARLGAGA